MFAIYSIDCSSWNRIPCRGRGYVFELQVYLLQLEIHLLLKQGIGLRFTGLIVPAGIVPAEAGDMFLNCRIIYLEQALNRLKQLSTG